MDASRRRIKDGVISVTLSVTPLGGGVSKGK